MPVTDSDVRAYLAERWSRSQPKEAALDYTADGAWRDAREGARAGIGNGGRRSAGTDHDGQRDRRGEAAEAYAAANDNAIVRVAREIRHAVNGWRHGAAVDAFEAERVELLAAWEELRERAREEGEVVALSAAFRETLDRHGALMKQAAMFRSKPQVFERLLAERAGIGEGKIEELRQQHARAGKYLRSVKVKASHAARQEADRSHEPKGTDTSVETQTAIPMEQVAETRQTREDEPVPVPPSVEDRDSFPASEHSEAAYRQLRRDWRAHVHRTERSGRSPFDLDGAAELIRRIREFAGKEDLPAEPRQRLEDLVGRYTGHVEAGARLDAWLGDADRHWRRYESIFRRAHALDVAPDTLRPYRDWLQRNERLLQAGRAILDDPGTYDVHLDRIENSRQRLRSAVSRMEGFSAERRTQSRSRSREPTQGL